MHVVAPTQVAIEHIGSTTESGLSAKLVTDLLLHARSLAAIEARIGALAQAGFAYVPKYEVELPNRRYFVRAAAAPRCPPACGRSVARGGCDARGATSQPHLQLRR